MTRARDNSFAFNHGRVELPVKVAGKKAKPEHPHGGAPGQEKKKPSGPTPKKATGGKKGD